MTVTKSANFPFGVVIDGDTSIDRVKALLAGIPGGAEKAVKSAIPRAVNHLKANASREIRKEYAISHKDLRTKENVTVRNSGNGLAAEVIFKDNKLPLYRFFVTPKLPTKKPTPVQAKIKLNSAPKISVKAFIATMKSGHTGVFERVTQERDGEAVTVLKERYALAIPQMLANDDVRNSLVAEAASKFNERVNHEITRILTMQGGV